MNQQKTIFICADHGLAIVYFLQTDVIKTILARGFRVVVLTDDGVTDKMREKFGALGGENLLFEGLRLDRAKQYSQEVGRKRQYWDHFIRWMGGSDRVNTNAIDSHMRQMAFETSIGGKVILPFVRAKVALMRKCASLRKRHVRSQMDFTPDIYGDLFDRYDPVLVIAGTAGWRLDRYLLREAAARGIETAYAVIGWDNPSSYRLPGAPVQWANCWSEIQKTELVDGADWLPERVHVGGIPTYDGYFRKEWLMTREEYFKLHGLDPERKLISFACSFVSFSPNYQDIEALVNLVSGDTLVEPSQLLIRLHPNHFIPGSLYEEEAKRIRALIAGNPLVHLVEPVALGGDLGFYSGEDMPEKSSMMAWSDVFCTVYSTMIVETAIHRRPIVAVCIDAPNGWDTKGKFSLRLSEIGEWPTHERFRDAKAGRVATTEDELRDALNLYLTDPETDAAERDAFVRAECTYMDGSSGQRVGTYFADRAEAAERHDKPVYPFDPTTRDTTAPNRFQQWMKTLNHASIRIIAAALLAIGRIVLLGGGRLSAVRLAVVAAVLLLMIVGVFVANRKDNDDRSTRIRRIMNGVGLTFSCALIGISALPKYGLDYDARAAGYLHHILPAVLFFGWMMLELTVLRTRKALRDGATIGEIFYEGRTVWHRWLIVLACSVVLVAYVPFRQNYYSSFDSSIFSYIGRRICEGGIPYVDGWDHKPPLVFYLNALGLTLTGGNLFGIWLLEWLFMVATALMLFRVLKTRFPDWLSLAATVLIFLHAVRVYDSGNYTEEYALLFQVWALLLYVLKPDGGLIRWLLSGILMGCAFSLKQTMIGTWVGLGICVLFETLNSTEMVKRERILRLIRAGVGVMLGFVAVNAVWWALFSARGALDDYLYGSFIYNLIYTAESPMSRWETGWTTLTYMAVISPFLMLGLISWVVGMVQVGWTTRRGGSSMLPFLRENRLWFWALVTLPVENVLAGLSGMNYQHYFIPMLVTYAVLIVALLDAVLNRLMARLKTGRVGTVTHLIVSVMLVVSALPVFPMIADSYTRRNPSVITKTNDFLRENTGPDDRIFLWGRGLAPYTMVNRRSPSRYFVVKSLYDFAETVGTDRWTRFLDDIRATPPKYIIYMRDSMMPPVTFDETGFCGKDLNPRPGEDAVFAYFCENYGYRETINKGLNDEYGVFEFRGTSVE